MDRSKSGADAETTVPAVLVSVVVATAPVGEMASAVKGIWFGANQDKSCRLYP